MHMYKIDSMSDGENCYGEKENCAGRKSMLQFAQNLGWSGRILLENFNKRVKKQMVDIWIKSIPGRGYSKCKGPEVGR